MARGHRLREYPLWQRLLITLGGGGGLTIGAFLASLDWLTLSGFGVGASVIALIAQDPDTAYAAVRRDDPDRQAAKLGIQTRRGFGYFGAFVGLFGSRIAGGAFVAAFCGGILLTLAFLQVRAARRSSLCSKREALSTPQR